MVNWVLVGTVMISYLSGAKPVKGPLASEPAIPSAKITVLMG